MILIFSKSEKHQSILAIDAIVIRCASERSENGKERQREKEIVAVKEIGVEQSRTTKMTI